MVTCHFYHPVLFLSFACYHMRSAFCKSHAHLAHRVIHQAVSFGSPVSNSLAVLVVSSFGLAAFKFYIHARHAIAYSHTSKLPHNAFYLACFFLNIVERFMVKHILDGPSLERVSFRLWTTPCILVKQFHKAYNARMHYLFQAQNYPLCDISPTKVASDDFELNGHQISETSLNALQVPTS